MLTDDVNVKVTGGALFGDVLTVDLGFTGSALPHALNVTFDGGGRTSSESTTSVIAGSGYPLHAQSFALQSNEKVTVTAHEHDRRHLAHVEQTIRRLLGTGILANVAVGVTVAGGSLTGQNISLSAASIRECEQSDLNLFGGLVKIRRDHFQLRRPPLLSRAGPSPCGQLESVRKLERDHHCHHGPQPTSITRQMTQSWALDDHELASTQVLGGVLQATGGTVTVGPITRSRETIANGIAGVSPLRPRGHGRLGGRQRRHSDHGQCGSITGSG